MKNNDPNTLTNIIALGDKENLDEIIFADIQLNVN